MKEEIDKETKHLIDKLFDENDELIKKIEKNEKKALNVNNKDYDNKSFDKILKNTIEDLKNNPNACTLIGRAHSTKSTVTIEESMPGKQLSEFIDYLYYKDLMDKEYIKNYKEIEDKKIEELTYNEVLTKITWGIRADRFNSGLLYALVKDGTMLNLLERIEKLKN